VTPIIDDPSPTSLVSPEAVNISNVAGLIDADGKPHFRYIVEGANLFFTQQARLHLEKRRVVLFKDSSANKGKRSSCFFWHVA
jgi:NAD-specific glutamate dehydrogenase